MQQQQLVSTSQQPNKIDSYGQSLPLQNPDQQQGSQIPGQMMVQPEMPLTMANIAQTMDQQLFNVQGYQRLQQANQLYVKHGKMNLCSDTMFCSCETSSLQVKSSLYSTTNVFEVKFNDVRTCQQQLRGDFSSLSYDGKQRQELYQIQHNRNCFVCKCCLLFVHPIGMLNWILCNKINPNNGEIRKNGLLLYTLKYSVCAQEVEITDNQNKLKYKLGNPGNCCDVTRELRDNYGDLVQGYTMNAQYSDYTRFGADIVFPQNMSEDDKAAIIFSMIRLS